MKVRHLDSTCVVSADGCAANLRKVLAGDLPRCTPVDAHERPLAIVGAGPSVRGYIEDLRGWPGEIWAINGAYDYLLSEGIVPHGFVGADPLPGLSEYVNNAHSDTTFYLSGLCDPAVFDALKGHKAKIFFVDQTDVKYPPGLWIVCGGTTALTRAPFLGKMLGYRDITMFGADSSFERGERYCYNYGTYAEDSKAKIIWVEINGEGPFPTEPGLAKQVSQLGFIASQMEGLKFRCAGLLDAFMRSPMFDDSNIELEDADAA